MLTAQWRIQGSHVARGWQMWSLELDCMAFLDDTQESFYFSKWILSLADIQSDSHRKERTSLKKRKPRNEKRKHCTTVISPEPHMPLWSVSWPQKLWGSCSAPLEYLAVKKCISLRNFHTYANARYCSQKPNA